MPFPRPFPSLPVPSLARSVPLTQTLLLALLPHGGQHTARRNAWSAMATDAGRARARRDAAAALVLAEARRAGAAGAVRQPG